jgi:hypothetical protein
MEQSTVSRSAPIAAILAIVGGALLAIGSFLTWAEVSGGGTSVTAKGVDGSDGWITLVCGAVVLLAGLAFLLAGGRKAIAVLAIVAGLVGGGVGLYDALTAKDRVLDDAAEELAGQFGGTKEEVRALLDQAIDAGELGISLGIGLYLVIAGGALGIVGGFLGMRGAPAPAAMPAPIAEAADASTAGVPPAPAPSAQAPAPIATAPEAAAPATPEPGAPVSAEPASETTGSAPPSEGVPTMPEPPPPPPVADEPSDP